MTDTEYREKRNALIPQAEDYATRVAGVRPVPTGGGQSFAGRMELQRWSDLWSLIFHRKMNELAKKSGLIDDAAR